MGHFRQLPKGFRGMAENISRRMAYVDLDDLAAIGNRAMRRFAKRRQAVIERRKAASCADVSTPEAKHGADLGASNPMKGTS